jgi:flagellar biosynthesis/type III secretory pathway chaperone
MTGRIQENLSRQLKALELLEELLEEEFSYLKTSKPQSVSRIEISIQELMRQLTVERLSLRAAVQEMKPEARRVREILPLLEPAGADALRAILAGLDKAEQACARRAAKNQNLVLALHQQSRNLLQFLHDRIQPKGTAYSASGRMARAANNPTLVTGRL